MHLSRAVMHETHCIRELAPTREGKMQFTLTKCNVAASETQLRPPLSAQHVSSSPPKANLAALMKAQLHYARPRKDLTQADCPSC